METGSNSIVQMPHKIHLSSSIFDKALNRQETKDYSLSIQVSLDGFSFCILDTIRNKYAAIEKYDFQDLQSMRVLADVVKDIISKSDWLHNKFSKVKIIYEGQQMSLIPIPLFDKEFAGDYLRFNHLPDANDKVYHDQLPNLDAVSVFALPGDLLSVLKKHFRGVTVNHFSSALIENLLIRNKNADEGYVIFANVRKQWLDIIVLDGRKLLFFNSFHYRSKEDFAYYLIYVMEQLGLNPEKAPLVLMGEILKSSDIYNITFKYVRNVAFIQRGSDYAYSYVFDDIPEHFYYNLLNLQRCEL
jgi:hypothetical protein